MLRFGRALPILLALALPATAAAKPHAPIARHLAAAPVPNDPLWRDQWGPRIFSLPTVWRRPVVRSVVVAVVDTGVDASQPDLAGAIVPGWNTLTGTPDTADDNGHGTMVAGVVGARADNRRGVAGYCPACSIMPVKALDSSGHGPGTAIAAGIDWATEHGANVINLSLVLTNDDSAVDAAIARASAGGVVVVAAAGNDGSTTPTYPAVEPGVVAVGASDSAGSPYPWSNAGEWVSLAAPGCNLTTLSGGGFGEFCGTSSAAAATSGLLGAVLATTTTSGTDVAAAAVAAARASRAIDAAALAAGPILGR